MSSVMQAKTFRFNASKDLADFCELKHEPVFSRATSPGESVQELAGSLTRDSLPSCWGVSFTRDSLPSCVEADNSASESESEDDTANDDAAFLAIAGLWWGAAGERYNVEKTAAGVWHCVRRGLSLGQQRVYPLSREAESGRLLCGDALVLDHVLEGRATWHSLRAATGGAKRRKSTWSRAKPADATTAPILPLPATTAAEAEAPEAAPKAAPKAAPEAADTYSLSMMLAVRLSLATAEGPKGQEPLGFSTRSFRPPPGLIHPMEAEPESSVAEPSTVGQTSGPTTTMLRNLPNQCTRGMLSKWLRSTEFAEDFDLVYLPMDRTSGNNRGYAFINFVEPTACQRFVKAIHGTKATACFPAFRTSKVLHVCIAKVQGKEAYVQALATSSQPVAPAADAWCAAAENTCSEDGSTTAEEREEPKTVPATSAATPCRGLRAEAPDFVPAAKVTSTDNFLEVLVGMPLADYSAAGQSKNFASSAFSGSMLFVPPTASPESDEAAKSDA